jgi:hypothetical protein
LHRGRYEQCYLCYYSQRGLAKIAAAEARETEAAPRAAKQPRAQFSYPAGECTACGQPRPAGNSGLCDACRARERALEIQRCNRESHEQRAHVRAVRSGKQQPDWIDRALLRDR